MTDQPASEDATVGEKLRAAIADADKTVRGYARDRAQAQWGQNPTFQQVEAKRRQLNGWLADQRTISDRSAEELAADLGKPDDYFKTARKPRVRRREEIAELRDQLAGIRERLDHLERLVRAAQEARREPPVERESRR